MRATYSTTLHLHGHHADSMPTVVADVHDKATNGVRLVGVDVGDPNGVSLRLVGEPAQLLALLHTMVIATEAAIEEAGGMDKVMGTDREAVSA